MLDRDGEEFSRAPGRIMHGAKYPTCLEGFPAEIIQVEKQRGALSARLDDGTYYCLYRVAFLATIYSPRSSFHEAVSWQLKAVFQTSSKRFVASSMTIQSKRQYPVRLPCHKFQSFTCWLEMQARMFSMRNNDDP